MNRATWILAVLPLLCSPALAELPGPPQAPLAPQPVERSNREMVRDMFDKSVKLSHELRDLSRTARYLRFDASETLSDIDQLTGAIGDPVLPVRPTPIYPRQPDPREEVKPVADADAVPTLTLPESVVGEVGAFIEVTATTNAQNVAWRMCDRGLNLFPVARLNTSLTAIVTAQTPGTYRLLAVAAIGGQTAFAETTVTVRGAVVIPPKPPPVVVIPDPPPVVIPPPVAEKFGLLTFTRNLVLANVPPEKRNACAGFAANYSMVVARISSNALTTFAAATAELTAANRVTAGGDMELWTAVISELSGKMKSLDQAGQFDKKNLEHVRQAFSEIAAGFLGAGN